VTENERALEVVGLKKAFIDHRRKRVPAVAGISFVVEPGTFFTLLGPSGCGKTTTLRCVAGLERPDAGVIRVADATFSAPGQFVPPYRRDIGMVFQSYAIWPHLTVFENVAFPLRVGREKLRREQIRSRVEEALASVAMDGLEGRMATELSGGQQQRLALARALIRRPKLLLLDEPLSNLDAKLRERMRIEVRDLQRQLGIATLYVTHDQAEALSMSNRIAVMDLGRIVQEGNPREIYQQPESSFVARFVGASNFIPGTVAQAGPGGTVRTGLAEAPLTVSSSGGLGSGSEITLTIRPENIRVHEEDGGGGGPPVPNEFRGIVEQTVFLGDSRDAEIAVGSVRLLVRHHPTLRLMRGSQVVVSLPPEHIAVLGEAYVPIVDADDPIESAGRP
jgi:iron(III) transport system ATP-binding protein